MSANYSDKSIIIPSYNDALAVGTTVAQMLRLHPKVIVVVDDGSQDETRLIVTKFSERFPVVYLRNATNRGQGYSLQRGLTYVYKNYPDANYVITVDADGQHHVDDVAKLLDVANENKYAVIYGVRKFTDAIPLSKKLSNLFCRITCVLLYGYTRPDPFCGLRCYARNIIPEIAFYPRHEWNISSNKLVSKFGKDAIGVSIQAIYSNYSLQKGLNLRKGVQLFMRILRLRLIELLVPNTLRPRFAVNAKTL